MTLTTPAEKRVSTSELSSVRRERLCGSASVSNKTALNVQTLKVTYDYDAFGQLVRRTEQGAAGGAVTAGNFVHDGGQIVLVLDGAGAVQHRLLWGAAVDQALADEALGTTYWYLTDHLGTVRDVVNNSGTVVNHLQYDAFGRRTGESNAGLGDFDLGYTGKWLDRATGLNWRRARWYNASIGRWLSEDPIGFAAGDANVARYVGNASTRYVDPSGLESAESGDNRSWWEWFFGSVPQKPRNSHIAGMDGMRRGAFGGAEGGNACDSLRQGQQMAGELLRDTEQNAAIEIATAGLGGIFAYGDDINDLRKWASIKKQICRFDKLSLQDQIEEYNNLLKTYKAYLRKYCQESGKTMGETNRLERELEAMLDILKNRGRDMEPFGSSH